MAIQFRTAGRPPSRRGEPAFYSPGRFHSPPLRRDSSSSSFSSAFRSAESPQKSTRPAIFLLHQYSARPTPRSTAPVRLSVLTRCDLTRFNSCACADVNARNSDAREFPPYVPRRFRKKLHRAHIRHRQQPRAQNVPHCPPAPSPLRHTCSSHSVKLSRPIPFLRQTPVKPAQTRQRAADAELLLRPLQCVLVTHIFLEQPTLQRIRLFRGQFT